MIVHDQLRVIRMYAPKSKLLCHMYDFCWIKFSPIPATLVLQKKFGGKKFRQNGKGHHNIYSPCNLEQKGKKFSMMRAGGENFLLVNISMYTVCA